MSSPARILIDGTGQWVVCHELSASKPITSIGRGSDCDVQLKHLRVSSKHAEIRPSGGGFVVIDLGSRNGTKINGEALSGSHNLSNGDVVTINPFTLRFQEAGALDPNVTFSGASVEEILGRRQKAKELSNQLSEPLAAKAIEKISRELEDFCEETAGSSDASEAQKQLAEASTEWRKALKSARRNSRRLLQQNRMLRDVLFATEAQDCYQALIETTAEILKAEVAFMMVINPSSQKWEVQSSTGEFQDTAAETEEGQARAGSPISLTLVTHAVKAKKAILSDDLPTDEREASASMILNEIQTGIAAPIVEGEDVVGCIYYDRREEIDDFYEAEDAADATAFAEVFRDALAYFAVRRASQ